MEGEDQQMGEKREIGRPLMSDDADGKGRREKRDSVCELEVAGQSGVKEEK
jgi:hypothetical protein